MPVCRKCGTAFPSRIKIDGKFHILSTRKFCLSCSPFGKHNTKAQIGDNGEKRCPKCKKTLPIHEFNNRRNGIGTSSYCRKCTIIQVLERTRLIKEKSISYKGGQCLICGYARCIAALEFHHLDSSKKDFSISSCKLAKFEKIRIELDKCILVCSNCHREIHSGLVIIPVAPPLQYYNKELDNCFKQDDATIRNFCCDCGVLLAEQKTVRCLKCHLKHMEKIDWPATNILLEMVENSSFSAVARKLGISDNAIRHRIKNHPITHGTSTDA